MDTIKTYNDGAYKALMKLGMPVLVTQLGVITVAFADTIMVGHYGVNELAVAAFVNSLFLVAIVMLMGLAGGITPLVGALYSQKDENGVGRTLRASLQLNVGVSLLFTSVMCVLFFFVDKMGQPAELMPLIKEYYVIMLATLVPSAVFNTCQQTANGTTDTMTPMWVILGANVLNIIGNYLLIFGKFGVPEMGLLGAGISTMVSRWVAAIVILSEMLWRRRYKVYGSGLRDGSQGRLLRLKVWKTSYPVMIQSGVECSLWTFGAVVCGWFGAIQLAAYQVVNTIGQLGFMIYMSFGVAVAIRTANMVGVKNMAGVRSTLRAGMVINVGLATVSSVVFFFSENWLLPLFTDSMEVAASAVGLIWPLILYQYCDAIQLTYCNAQRGTSFVRPLLWASLISYLVVGIPAALLLGKGLELGNVGVYYSFCVALLVAALLLGRWYYKTVRRLEHEYGEFINI